MKAAGLACWHDESGVSDSESNTDQVTSPPDDKGAAQMPRRRVLLDNLYQRYWLELRNYVYKSFGSGPPEPDDVVQTAFTRLAALENPESIDNPRAFLYTTSRNAVLDHHRRTQTRDAYVKGQIQTEGAPINEISPERVSLEREQLLILVNTLTQMSETRRRLLLENRLDGLAYSEIGRRMGLTEGAVRKQVKKALAECMQALDDTERRSETLAHNGKGHDHDH